LRFVVSHPCDKNENVARMGQPVFGAKWGVHPGRNSTRRVRLLLMNLVSLEAVYIENRLDVLEGYLPDDSRIERANN